MKIQKISTVTPQNNLKRTDTFKTKESNIMFKGKQSVLKNGFVVGSALAASALFASSIKEIENPEQIIKEYYENENMNGANGDIGGVISRFSPEEQYEILQYSEEIEFFPNAFKKIAGAKNKDNNYRFDSEETLDLLLEEGKNIENYPEIFDTILDAKDKKDNNRFNFSDCMIFMSSAKELDKYPKAFNMALAIDELSAEECRDFVLSCGDIAGRKPQYLSQALKEVPAISNHKHYWRNIAHRIKEIDAKIRKEAEERDAQIREENMKKSAERKIVRLDENRRIKQEILDRVNKETGWVSPEQFIEKVNNAKQNNTRLILESGEEVPDDVRDNIAIHIQKHPSKAKALINLRYKNKVPVFNEKECCEMIKDLDSYFYYYLRQGSLREIKDDGTPFYSPEQCLELLKRKDYWYESSIIEDHRFKYKDRMLTSDEIMDILKYSDEAGYDKLEQLKKLAEIKDENGDYKFNIQECINLSRGKTFCRNN